MAKIKDLTLLSDIFPTGFHGASTAGVGPGSIVYVAGAGPVGLACASSCHLLGAAVVIVGDMIPERLEQARSFGCETVDLRADASLADQIDQIVGEPEVDQAVDCVGFEARGHGKDAAVERPATVLNSVMDVTRAGGGIGIPGLYVTGDPGGIDDNAKVGNLSIRIGLGWAKSHHFTTGQCPVMRYHRQLMTAILHDKIDIAKHVNVTMISLDEGPKGYQDFDKGAAKEVRDRPARHGRRLSHPSLFLPKCLHRLDGGGTSRRAAMPRQPARAASTSGTDDIRRRVGRAHAEQHARQEPGDAPGAHEPDARRRTTISRPRLADHLSREDAAARRPSAARIPNSRRRRLTV